LVVILHDLDRLPELLDAWKKAGVPGVTILQSAGGFHAEALVRRGGLGGLLNLFEQSDSQQRLVFSLVDDPEILALGISEADRVVKGFDRPHSGILFTIPIGEALGLQKWPKKYGLDELDLQEEAPKADKGDANLLRWFEKELEDLHDRATLKDWEKKRSQPISEIVEQSDSVPTIVRVDTPLKEVIAAFLATPRVPVVSVINSEERLVGVIEEKKLAELLLIPAMPEHFIHDPDGYDRALKYAKLDPDCHAGDIMGEPFFVSQEGSLEQAYVAMKNAALPGLPVVDKHYHVTGYLTILEVLAVYFGGK
jgi:CBS domain-containing protein